MRIQKAVAASIAAIFVAIAIPASIVAADQPNPQSPVQGNGPRTFALTNPGNPQAGPVCSRQSAANALGQDIFLSTGNPKIYTSTSWQPVDCTSTTFRLKNGTRALVVANVTAETDCNGSDPNNGQWCEARALLNGTEGKPQAPEPDSFAFDSVGGGRYNWQAHAFERAWEVRCASENGCQYKFVVQTKNHNSTVTDFWLDEVAVNLHLTYGDPAAL